MSAVRLLLVPLLLSAIHRSGRLAASVEIRGIRDTVPRLLTLERPGSRDYALAVMTLAVLWVAWVI